MSIKVKELLEIIEKIAPEELAEEWDNTGMQISINDGEIINIFVCLDINDETIDEAIKNDCDFMISHHPLFFEGIKEIEHKTAVGKYVKRLIQADISVYSAHTSFDTAKGGNNDFLANLFELDRIETPDTLPIIRTGYLKKPMRMEEMCSFTAKALGIQTSIRFAGDENKIINKIAICSGSGASIMGEAKELGCDLLITGDLKYHDAQRAKQLEINVIDAGHFETEIFFVRNFTEKLERMVKGSVNVIMSQTERNSINNKIL